MLNKVLKPLVVFMLMISKTAFTFADKAPESWLGQKVEEYVKQNVLYLPIASEEVKAIPINETKEEMVDLLEIKNPRIKPLSTLDPAYQNTYDGYSKVRKGVYERLIKMLEILPKNIGIAYFEGFRPLHKQKEYFDKKFKEILAEVGNKELAYRETTKHVSPFIDNIPTHATGAAIDITIFITDKKGQRLLDMGKFDTIFGPNEQQETFSPNTTMEQRKNRIMLLSAATKAGLVNYGFEYWHYSYGDKPWAYVKKKAAIYGLVVDKDDPILSIDKQSYLQSFD